MTLAKIATQQKLFQSGGKFIHLMGPHDQIISNIIPGALTAASFGLVGYGMINMANGTGKKEGF